VHDVGLDRLTYKWERCSFYVFLSDSRKKMQLQGEQLSKSRRGTILIGLIALAAMGIHPAFGQLTENEQKASVGDAPTDPGPLANDLSGALAPASIQSAMRKVAQWQNVRIVDTPSQDWTFATLYVGMLSASATLKDDRYRDTVLKVAEHYHWALGPRKTHADDQAIGQAYLWLYRQKKEAERIAPLTAQFDEAMQLADDPAKPVWWWCDALFMAPPVWAGLAATKHDARYLAYMDQEWKVTSSLLWDAQEQLFFRDNSYFDKHEKNGRKVFWSRGNGWVMGGLVRVLDSLPIDDPRRLFYVDKLQRMAAAVAKLQGVDGLWRPGLLDAKDYPYPEVSGSAFFVYAMAWGINHQLLDSKQYLPVVEEGWKGLVNHVYADGRLGCIQPIETAPGAYTPGASYVFGTGAFLLAGSEVDRLAKHRPRSAHHGIGPRR
jgi:unsaturated rhamnogalacturonyl hydrolase